MKASSTGNREDTNISSICSLNWHLWPRCNYHCIFCFGRFKEINHKSLSLEKAIQILHVIKKLDIKKITFTGGEPLLCPYLGDLLIKAKFLGFVTMVVSNGSLITQSFLYEYHSYIDWIGLSIDSIDDRIEKMLGRGKGNHIRHIKEIVPIIRSYGIKLKINVVVHRLNYQEDFSDLINDLKPDRLKFFQLLKIYGENDINIDHLLISEEQFKEFAQRHQHLNPIIETNNLMIGSYVMLDPLGRFFQNFNNNITYSPSILDVDPFTALNTVGWDYQRFVERGGYYQW